MATQAHASAEGFCLCHLKCVWHMVGKVGIYLGYYNAGYVELEQRFTGDEQLYVHVMALFNLFASLTYLWLSQGWIYDRLIFLLYVPLYIYFLLLRKHLVNLLNECVRIHRTMERILGNWMCVKIPKECLYSLMLIIQTGVLLCWQMRMYYAYQMCFIAGVAIIYHLEMLFLGNYLIWLGCLYRSSYVFLRRHMTVHRHGILKGVLQQQIQISRVHRIVMRYFSLHLISFMGMVGGRIMNLMADLVANEKLSIDRLNLINLITQSLHLALILIITHNAQRQYEKFLKNFLALKDNEKYFQLKAWRLLKHQTLPMPFGLPLMRIPKHWKRNRDVIAVLEDFDVNVTQTISQFYRWYNYDEYQSIG
ncbi:uncharacterized protein Grl62b [Drosophila tropicalis]|uniref:uncharacterized protein Grl62b n=1 Tax=Drosophila tropicalis TaxID=46794 RepID=UPI0035AB940B